jgi:hypothetical protein
VVAATCFVVGDSIATRPYGLGGWFSQCVVAAKIGIPSGSIIPRVPTRHLRWLVISAGSNDPRNPMLPANLRAIRGRARSDKVIWIAPAHPEAAKAVRSVAAEHGDAVVAFVPGRDRVHPMSYSVLARAVAAHVPPSIAER